MSIHTICVFLCLVFCCANAFDLVMNVTDPRGSVGNGYLNFFAESLLLVRNYYDGFSTYCQLYDTSSGAAELVGTFENCGNPQISDDGSLIAIGRAYFGGGLRSQIYRYNGTHWVGKVLDNPVSASTDFPYVQEFIGSEYLITIAYSPRNQFQVHEVNATDVNFLASYTLPKNINSATSSPSGSLIAIRSDFPYNMYFIDTSDFSTVMDTLSIPFYTEKVNWITDELFFLTDTNYDMEYNGVVYNNWGRIIFYRWNGTTFENILAFSPSIEDIDEDVLLEAIYGENSLSFGRQCNFLSLESLIVCNAGYSYIAYPFDTMAIEFNPSNGVARLKINFQSSTNRISATVSQGEDWLYISEDNGDKIVTPSICYCYFKRGECVDSDQCTDCFSGSYGTECDACECQNNGACDDGFSGTGSCDCSNTGYYGEYCENRCTCLNGICNTTTGICTSAGCVRGYYGDNCDQTCSCVNGVCDRATGECNSQEPCFRGFGGPDCDQPCTCVNGDCNALNECRCYKGWTGADCSSCKPGYYLSEGDCVKCNCRFGTCQSDGSCVCESGFNGATCSNPVLPSPDPVQEPAPTPLSAPYVAIIIFGCLLGAVIIGLVVAYFACF